MDLESDALREKLLKEKLGSLLHWRAPKIEEAIGPWNPKAFECYEQDHNDLVAALRERLKTYSHEELLALLDGQDQEYEIAISFWRSFLSDWIDRLKRQQPPWYAGGFGHPDHVADLEYWSKMDRLTTHELLCLSLGVDPASLTLEEVGQLRNHKKRSRLWEPAQFLLRQDELLRRRFGTSPTLRVRPAEFLTWAEKVDANIHPKFLEHLRQYHAWHPGAREQSEQGRTTKTDKREVDTMAKLFVVMAIEQLGYQPDARRSPIPKEITDLAAEHGIKISEDTVRKYLNRGAEFLDPGGETD